MAETKILELFEAGQSAWLDYISRPLIEQEELPLTLLYLIKLFHQPPITIPQLKNCLNLAVLLSKYTIV